MSNFWKIEQHCLAARVLFADGMSAGEAAAELTRRFGWPIKRNAVIGCWHRMGLRRFDDQRGNKARRERAYAARGQKGTIARIKRNSASSIAQRMAMAAQQRERIAAEESEPVDIRLSDMERAKHACTLFELTNTSCRWPNGDPGKPGFFFCGVPEADCDHGRPYCAAHARIAFDGIRRRAA